MVEFIYSKFNQMVEFRVAKFNQMVKFSYSKFNQIVEFRVAKFNQIVEFRAGYHIWVWNKCPHPPVNAIVCIKMRYRPICVFFYPVPSPLLNTVFA